ncbi:copper resistance CopC family protein [Dactylosporangium fulvum]|uniref:Copper resistance protein CopC n=1 Tax=Dactylosporangium fulvum TaxID=53359 RepID=A0ABY5VVA7_9ACTN|nr:copper resistance CopC family protein [Dactylosporangium fulvum]UWP81712.1 copper resistance protein CopC [Dactylosporangium fulvum]
MTARALARLIGATLLATLAGALVLATPASAHTTLRQSDPAANSTVPTLPEVVRLTFTDMLPIVPKVTVRDPDGTEVNSSPISPRGNTVLQPVKSTKTGRFTVTWELTGSDGHKTNGSFSFTVQGAAAPPSAVPSPTAPVVGSGSPSTVPTAAASTAAAASSGVASPSDAARSSTDSGGGSWWVWLVVAVVLLGAVGGGVVFFRRRGGTPSP